MATSRYVEHLATQILEETIQEDILQLLEDVILEDIDSTMDQRSVEERTHILSIEISRSLIIQTVEEETYNVIVDLFDQLVLHHRLKTTGVTKLNQILYQVCDEMVEEIVLEVINGNLITRQVTGIAEDLLHDLVNDEVRTLCDGILDHYHMRAGISRFKQIQSSAAAVIMDKVVLNSLLKQPDSTSNPEKQELDDFGSKCLNNMIFDVLLSQSLALHSCTPKTLGLSKEKSHVDACMDWFKEKFVTDVAVNVLLDKLVSRIDETMSLSVKKK